MQMILCSFNNCLSKTAIPRKRIVPLDSISSDRTKSPLSVVWLNINSAFVSFPFWNICFLASSGIGAAWIIFSISSVIITSSSLSSISEILKSDAFKKSTRNFFRVPSVSLSKYFLAYAVNEICGWRISFIPFEKKS